MVGRALFVDQAVEDKRHADAEQDGCDIEQHRGYDDHGVERAARLDGLQHSGTHRERDQRDRIIQGDDLQDGIDKLAVRMVLPDRHDGGGGRRGAADRADQQGEGHRQAEDKDHGQRDDRHGHERFKQRDDHGFATVAAQGGELEVFARFKGDEGQRHIRDEIHAGHDIRRDGAQQVGADQDAREQVARYIGEVELLGQPGHQETGKQHNGQAQDDLGSQVLLGNQAEQHENPSLSQTRALKCKAYVKQM